MDVDEKLLPANSGAITSGYVAPSIFSYIVAYDGLASLDIPTYHRSTWTNYMLTKYVGQQCVCSQIKPIDF